MARKSRKNAEPAAVEAPLAKVYEAGAYVRLSAVDRKHKGDSIENQQAIIAAFIAERPDITLREVYIDNGTTGTNFEREGFQRMLADLDGGKINCCVSKDLSRLGRSAIDTGFYIEKYFPTRGIRYIAINDKYDSADGSGAAGSPCGSIAVSLQNMVNEHFALEVGRKIRATKQMNIKSGLFVGAFPPYGYFKDSADGHKLVVDPCAAQTVRRMFEMAAGGEGVAAILKWLNGGSGILPPRRYLHSVGVISAKMVMGGDHWNMGVVNAILRNRVYVGDMVQGKGKTYSYAAERVPKSEWVVVPDTHEGIVSREMFDAVQRAWGPSHRHGDNISPRYKQPKVENIFLRKVFCGHCGHTMSRTRTGETQYNFKCTTQHSYGRDDCTLVSINEGVLKARLVEQIQRHGAAFDKRVDDALAANVTAEADNAELRGVQSELARNSRFLSGLYESLVSGDITDSEYKEMKRGYETKIAALTERERDLRDTVRERWLNNAARSKTTGSVSAVRSADDLTAQLVDALVDRILVFEDKHIEVRFKFSEGNVTLENAEIDGRAAV